MTRLFSTHGLHPDVSQKLSELGELTICSAPTPEAILDESEGAEIIVVRAPIAPEIIRREAGLKALVRHGAGLDMIPVEVATEVGTLVANVPGANAPTVAEHAIWSALSLLRAYPDVHADLRANGWEAARKHAGIGRELSGRTIGIIGMGAIGQQIARIAQSGFGMSVKTHTRSPETAPEGVEPLYLDALLATSDVVVLACPLTPETRGLIGKKAFELMQPTTVLINVSRGPVVDEQHLVDALRSRSIAGAALDVFAEQPLAPDHPLLSLTNVILTPHMAGITTESMRRMGMGVVEEVTRILSGELPRNFVNPEALGAYRARFAP